MVRKITRKKPETKIQKDKERQTGEPKNMSAYNQQMSYKLYGYEEIQIPTKMREPFVLTKYRFPGLTAGQCVCSIIQPHNEAINIWTHLIGLTVFLIHIFPLIKTIHPFEEPFVHPLLYVILGSCTMLVVSVCAHLFNSMSPYAYHVCFFFDYAAISFATFTFSQGLYFYARPLDTPWNLLNSPEMYLSLSLINSLVCTFSCCAVLVKRPWYHIFVRTSAYLSLALFTALPYLGRLALCSLQPTSGCATGSVSHFKLVCLSFAAGGIIYAFRFPECWIPKVFDLLGHSHNIFHVLSALGIVQFFIAIHNEMVQRRQELLSQPLAWGQLSAVFCVLAGISNFGLVIWFSQRLYSRQTKKL